MDAEEAALQAELAALEAQVVPSATVSAAIPQAVPVQKALQSGDTQKPWYSPTQLAFDVGAGLAKASYGLADMFMLPFVGAANLAGANMPYFGMSEMGQRDIERAAAITEVAPQTPLQDLVSFVAPSPVSKASKLGQALAGGASFVGMKSAEAIAPDSKYAGLVGALSGAALTGPAVKGAFNKIAPQLEEVGLGLQRRALGITKADYKAAKNAIIETVDGEFSTQLKQAADELIQNKTLGTSLDPLSMYDNLQTAKNNAETAIQSVLKAKDLELGSTPSPAFEKTLNYISKNVAADEVDAYLKKVIDLQDAIQREGGGSLVYLNQQKKVIGENWKNSPQSDPGFWRTLYSDMKTHIEKYAPEVKDLNKEKQKLIIVEPIITRNFKASAGNYDIGTIQRLLNTTGGAGLAGGAILGSLAGNAGAGVAAAGALRALSTPGGQNIVGRGLRGISSTASSLATALSDMRSPTEKLLDLGYFASKTTPAQTQDAELAALEQQLQQLESETSAPPNVALEPTQSPLTGGSQESKTETAPLTATVKGTSVSLPTGQSYAPPSLVKAVIQAESRGRPYAVSKKGAGGLMQLMPQTAKALGINPADRFDPQTNVEAGSRYLKQMLDRFGSYELALAAYNFGPTAVAKRLKAVEQDNKKPTWNNIKHLVPAETRAYVANVTKNIG